jgi:manganese oxidase
MGGLVAGIEVRPAEDDTTVAVPPPDPVRRLHVHIQENVGSTPWRPFYGIAVADAPLEPAPQSGQTIGPPIVLYRGEPASLMLHNRTGEATAIHWHGMELESFFDGVPGFSGVRPQVTPPIAPADSFEARITPPRAGTFIYHSHASETRQQRAGIVGALLVVDRARYDATRELPVVISSPSDSTQEEDAVLLNGSLTPVAPMLRRATAYRIRLINITTGRPGARVELRRDSTLLSWRPLAKDGADIPAPRRVLRPAEQGLSIGETMDVEWFPTAAGEYRLEVRTTSGRLLGTLPLRVQ